MTASPSSKAHLARRAWRIMFDYFMASGPDRERSLEQRGLTPNDARALWSLDRMNARPIGTLARDWDCDPANATFIINRLEEAGLAERRPGAEDRRVKLVSLTDRGFETKNELLAEYRMPPAAFAALPPDDLEAMVSALEKLPGARP